MPLLHHPVLGPLAGNREAVQLARQPDRKVADVDHLLHLAEALGHDLPGFQRHHLREQRLCLPQFLAEQPDELAAPRRRNPPPGVERSAARSQAASGSPFVTLPMTAPSMGEWLAIRPA